jgi:hypothetical protein
VPFDFTAFAIFHDPYQMLLKEEILLQDEYHLAICFYKINIARFCRRCRIALWSPVHGEFGRGDSNGTRAERTFEAGQEEAIHHVENHNPVCVIGPDPAGCPGHRAGAMAQGTQRQSVCVRFDCQPSGAYGQPRSPKSVSYPDGFSEVTGVYAERTARKR